MKIVLDTNVLIAAFIAHGTCAEVLEHCMTQHVVVLSQPILAEFREVLVHKCGFALAEAKSAARLLKSRASIVKASPLAKAVCRDSDDDSILATAVSGGCQAILSGDKDLTDLQEYHGIRILKPAEFWRFEGEMEKRE